MVMMLRSQGVPARMAAGFAQGELDGNRYVVRERDAHTWVEVYFPGYGWIEFEPTAAQAPLDRGDENSPTLPTATPLATSTPTITPTLTPSPSPTATEQGTLPPPENEQLSLPTTTPTLTPTPTATPVIIPTQTPPLQQPPRGPIAFILPALMTALLGLVVIAIIAGVVAFIWWWWEWRGMRGFTPAVRAYARLERYIVGLLGLPMRDQDTPLERRDRIVPQLPRRASRSVAAITQMYTEERYGRGPDSEAEVKRHEVQADKAWKHTRETIIGRWLRKIVPFANFFWPQK